MLKPKQHRNSTLPDSLRTIAEQAFANLLDYYSPEQKVALVDYLCSSLQVESQLHRTLALSEFVGDVALANPDWFFEFLLQNQGGTKHQLQGYLAELEHENPAPTAGASDALSSLRRKLIQLRNRCMVFIIWRDLNQLSDLDETTCAMSQLADCLINYALAYLYEESCQLRGVPIGAVSGQPQKLVVLALGKLGGFELNLSSDVDLVFAYPEAGVCKGSSVPNQSFFLELAQNLIKVLDHTAVDGFVFRVDMRLRPYGESGALVSSFNAMEVYYSRQGREWERYAWVKVRACAGDVCAGAEIINTLRPFVYRRYLDFGSIESLRIMKARMDRVGRNHKTGQELKRNLKLGPGGIRDIEFIVQLQQLIWGGRYPELQLNGFMPAMQELINLKLLERDTADRLREAYVFLRRSEHVLQAIGDKQTQLLPDNLVDQERLAVALGFANYEQYLVEEKQYRDFVQGELQHEAEEEEAYTGLWESLWHTGDQNTLEPYFDAGAGASTQAMHQLKRLKASRDQPRVGGRGQQRLDALMPHLLSCLVELPHPLRTLERCVKILESVLRRSSYLVMLQENEAVLKRLLQLVANSGYIAAELALNPWLIDEIIDPRMLKPEDDRASLLNMLDISLGRVDSDLENFIEVIRTFKESITFAVAVGELDGNLPLMRVSDYLSFSAEAILQRAFEFAWYEVNGQFDQKVKSADLGDGRRSFAIIGYGKLGGIELGPASDLDLVFLHDMDASQSPFLYRLARRLIHILTIRTRSGGLFEIDTRLRPSGSDGTMVSSIDAFENYQLNSAWTWEHQALVRARFVAGDPGLGRKFDRLRTSLLTRPRNHRELREQVLAMRERMLKSASKQGGVKQSRGGIVDIEFIVQYLVLAWANKYPQVCRHTDNVRILEALGQAKLLDCREVQRLIEAYLGLRAEQHLAALDLPDQGRALQAIERYHDWISAIWDRVLLDESTE